MIEKNIVHVSPEKAMSHLKPRLDGFRKSWDNIYIGVTTNPEPRWAQHQPRGWKKMVLLYEAFGAELARSLARDLVDYAGVRKFQVVNESVKPDEAAKDGRGSHFLYVLLK